MLVMRIRALLVASVACLLAGCATMQQRVAAYPAYGQSAERFAQESRECEQWARSNATPPGGAVAAGTLGGAALGAGLGAAVGAIAGSFVGAADSGAALGAALGGVEGAAGGAGAAAQSVDQQLLAAYQNCMVARGYAVNGSVPPPPQSPTATVAAAVAAPEESAPSSGSPEERLRQLRQLREEGLITEREYQQVRRRVIDAL